MDKKKKFWDFDIVVKTFDDHISKSVPGYIECQDLASDISVFFVKNKSIVYDVGCSTGTFTKLVYKKNNEKKINSFAYDISEKMIKYAKYRKSKIKFIKKDVTTINFKKSDFISSMYRVPPRASRSRRRWIWNACLSSLIVAAVASDKSAYKADEPPTIGAA